MRKLALVTLALLALSACSTAEPPQQPKAAPAVQQTQAPAQSSDGKLDLSDPRLQHSATSVQGFLSQTVQYTDDLTTSLVMIETQMSGKVDPVEFKAKIQPDLAQYNAAVQKALSIPKPSEELMTLYNGYIAGIKEYAKFPDMLNKALDANDRNMIEAAYAQSIKGQKIIQEAFTSPR